MIAKSKQEDGVMTKGGSKSQYPNAGKADSKIETALQPAMLITLADR